MKRQKACENYPRQVWAICVSLCNRRVCHSDPLNQELFSLTLITLLISLDEHYLSETSSESSKLCSYLIWEGQVENVFPLRNSPGCFIQLLIQSITIQIFDQMLFKCYLFIFKYSSRYILLSKWKQYLLYNSQSPSDNCYGKVHKNEESCPMWQHCRACCWLCRLSGAEEEKNSIFQNCFC